MTAEIAIMNKEAIALASDSAVTMIGKAGQKIFSSANKLFTLSKYHPVGIMVYGDANFMGVPWETIIKIYRKKLDNEKFDTLQEYAINFINFLDNGNPLFPSSVQDDFVRKTIYSYFNFIKNLIRDKVHSIIEENNKISYEEIKIIVSEIIVEHYECWEKSDKIPSIPKNSNKTIIDEYNEIIERAIKGVFQELFLSKSDLVKLKKIGSNLFSKFTKRFISPNISGVAIAGFGEKDTFPSIKSFNIEGIAINKLKYQEDISEKIEFNKNASIIAFAQKEMVVTFMEGIDPYYRNIEESFQAEILNDYMRIMIDSLDKYTNKEKEKIKEKLEMIIGKILDYHKKSLEDIRRKKYVNPIIRVVSILPKDELAMMAETLINLTSFKRKVTMESETVGGPIDVAVVSKGDGFVWIKRKHYFKSELNPFFITNYFKEDI